MEWTGNKYYIINSNSMCVTQSRDVSTDWVSAMEECRKDSSDIITVHDDTENLIAMDAVERYHDSVWIGLTELVIHNSAGIFCKNS